MKGVFLDFDTIGPEDINISSLTAQLPDLQLFSATGPELVAERTSGAEIVIVNKVRLDEKILRGTGSLKLICLAATGADNVSLNSAKALGIAVCNIRNYCTPSVVQHVFSLILGLTNHLRAYDQALREKAWSTRTQFCLLDFPTRELDGKILGIIGLGSLGTGVAKAASAFGMDIIAVHRGSQRDVSGIEKVSLSELLERADIVSLHCPLNTETENMIDAKALRQMRQDALLINTARGGLVDSQTLVDALQSGEIAGAGIDVLRQEPPIDPDPIFDTPLPNLIVTPHVAWAARESRQRAVDEIAANIASFNKGEQRNQLV
jgi:glycerate dehydrogenase